MLDDSGPVSFDNVNRARFVDDNQSFGCKARQREHSPPLRVVRHRHIAGNHMAVKMRKALPHSSCINAQRSGYLLKNPLQIAKHGTKTRSLRMVKLCWPGNVAPRLEGHPTRHAIRRRRRENDPTVVCVKDSSRHLSLAGVLRANGAWRLVTL